MKWFLIFLTFTGCANNISVISIQAIDIKHPGNVITRVETTKTKNINSIVPQLTLDIINATSIGRKHLVIVKDIDKKQEVITTLIKQQLSLEHIKNSGFSEMEYLIDLEKRKDILNCETTACITEIGMALNADYILSSKIFKSDGEQSISNKIEKNQKRNNKCRKQKAYNYITRIITVSGLIAMDTYAVKLGKQDKHPTTKQIIGATISTLTTISGLIMFKRYHQENVIKQCP